MIGNKDFALLYAGRAAFNRNGEYAGTVAGRNGMHGVISGVDHVNGRQSRGANGTGVPEDEFLSYEYRNAGMPAEEAPEHKTTGGLIREHGGMKPVGTGDGSENVPSEIREEKVWGEKVWKH